MEALLSAWLDECQAVEDALWDVFEKRELQDAVATGDLLAKLGKIPGQTSEGLSDALFLILITARIRANRSTGKREDLIKLVKLLVPNATTIVFHDYPPASIYIEPKGAMTLPPYLVGLSFVAVAVAAGVLMMLVWTQVDPANTITLGSVYNPGFAVSSNVPTNTGVTANQSLGSIYNSGFTAGPPPTNTGGGMLAGVIQTGVS
jgi:hypothetical protein